MIRQQLISALQLGCELYWSNPDPIPGNDYRITEITILDKHTALIEYGGGSEAEVFLEEIMILPPLEKKEKRNILKYLATWCSKLFYKSNL